MLLINFNYFQHLTGLACWMKNLLIAASKHMWGLH